ncbi:MAG: carboxylating nicotinate-nucleotide diphosphorylase [Victivallales bacterium]|nr:carboxylating nicotinate-nucleotide diphosphorylase [Victivallales bacterium]
MKLNDQLLTNLCQIALMEDVGAGDVTTQAIIPKNMTVTAYFTTRQDCVCCGLPVVEKVYAILDRNVELECHVKDGDHCLKDTRMATVSGPAQAILTGERVALNYLQRLSGVATITHRYVEALGDSATQILDTRKTTPGLRFLEKYAVTCGGGTNHRIGLFDMFMIKDNHRELAKYEGTDSIARAVAKCREYDKKLAIEVEADTLDEVQAAVKAGADVVMFDNMSNEEMVEALKITKGHCKTEASGGITLERIPSLANLGLDFISVGALTHSAPSVDIGLDM